MRILALGCLLASWIVASVGCGHVALTEPEPADRVIEGIITSGGEINLPPQSEVTIHVLDLSRGEQRAEVLAEATIENPPRLPVPFRVEFRAEDRLLMRSVAVQVRVSVGGRLRYTNAAAQPVTLANLHDSHVIQLVAAANRQARRRVDFP